MMPLAGQVAVVTGASRGVGEAIAKSLAGQGATVVRLARSLRPIRSSASGTATAAVVSARRSASGEVG